MTHADLIQAIRAHRIDSAGTIPPTLQHTRAGTPMWKCPCGRSDSTESPHKTEICPDALERVLSESIVLTANELEQGVHNLRVDPTCGACMGIFFTGMSIDTHTCPGPHPEVIVTLGEGPVRMNSGTPQ